MNVRQLVEVCLLASMVAASWMVDTAGMEEAHYHVVMWVRISATVYLVLLAFGLWYLGRLRLKG